MPDLFSLFSPKKKSSDELVVTAEEVKHDEAIDEIVDEKVNGIININYASLGDLASVEDLSVALFELEEKKKSLEEEINNLYKSEISLDDLLDLVTKITSSSRVSSSRIEEDEIADIDDCFDMLKSTAVFVEKRLNKIRLKSDLIEQEILPIPVDEHEELIENDFFCPETETAPINIGSSDEINIVCNDAHHKDEAPKKSEEDLNKDTDCDGIKLISGDLEDSLEAHRVSYEDFVNTIEDVNVNEANGKDQLLSKFGPQRTRWSLRRVFKKKNS